MFPCTHGVRSKSGGCLSCSLCGDIPNKFRKLLDSHPRSPRHQLMSGSNDRYSIRHVNLPRRRLWHLLWWLSLSTMQNIRRMCTTCCQQRVDVRNWLDSTPLEQSHHTTYETAQSYTTFHPELVGARLRSEVLVHSSCNRKQRKHEQLAEFEIEPSWYGYCRIKHFQSGL